MGSTPSQNTEMLTEANTNFLVDRLDDVDESGGSVMKHILRDRVPAMRARTCRLGVGFGGKACAGCLRPMRNDLAGSTACGGGPRAGRRGLPRSRRTSPDFAQVSGLRSMVFF